MASKQEKLVIIDSNALLHRAWHAIPPLKTKDGLLVNTVFGYTSLLLKILKELSPDYIIASFDVAGKTFRHEEYEDYKAQRIKQADEFYQQIPLAQEVLKAFNIPIISKAGYEADDIIGTLSQEAYKKYPHLQIIIITGDLDTLQLVNDRTKVLTLKRGFNDTIIYDREAVKERYGLEPRQLIDLKAIQGDASDNIKGVKGIGEKGANDLIKQFGTLENLYKNIAKSEVKERIKNLLLDQKDGALASKHLVTIVRDVPLTWQLSEALLADFDVEKVYAVFQKFEFHSLLNKVPHQKSNQHGLSTTAKKDRADYQIVSQAKDFTIFYEQLKKQTLFALDSETTGLDLQNAEVLGLSFSWQEKTGWYLNLADKKFASLALQQLKPILEDQKVAKVGHNLKFDLKVLKMLNINLEGITFDTLLAAYLINPSRGLKLEELAFTYLGYKKLKLTDLLPAKPTKKKNLDIKSIPLEKLAWYSAEDADISLRLYQKLLTIIKENKNFELLQKIELPLIPVLATMELNGLSLNTTFLKTLEKQFSSSLKKLETKIFKMAGQEFNISSPLQLKKILFENLDLSSKGIKKIKTGLSTGAAELEKMKDLHPIIPLLSEYRELSKLQSTYILALPNLVNKKTQRLHTNFNQTITTTGRLSSSNPNLQNIPIRTDLGKQIREAFIAPPDHLLLCADYSQIELRLAASLSKDPKMIVSFKNNEDIHARTAAEIHKIPLDQVTKEIRRTAKEINFGVIYGLGSTGLAQRTGLTRPEAKEFINRYFTIYKKIKDYIIKTKAFAHNHGYVQTLFGRRRYLSDINSSLPMLQAAAERMAVNMPLQGTAADLMKMAMITLAQGLPTISPRSKIILQVHDELVLEVPSNDLKPVAKFVKATMENVYQLPVPLMVDLEVGPNWGDLKNYHL
jgi:DNA polymerase-1